MVEKFREGELYDSMAPLPTNCEQMAVHPLVLLTFGPLRRCRYATDIVTVELAVDPLVVLVFRRLRWRVLIIWVVEPLAGGKRRRSWYILHFGQ